MSDSPIQRPSREATASTLLVLVGPKGSGKTHVGSVVETRLGVRFIRVEPIFRELDNRPEAFVEVERRIDSAFADAHIVAIESTGAAPEHIRALLERFPRVKLIRLHASAATCFSRFKARDASAHIPVSDERFREINERAAAADFDWDCVLDNETELSEVEIADAVRAVVLSRSARRGLRGIR